MSTEIEETAAEVKEMGREQPYAMIQGVDCEPPRDEWFTASSQYFWYGVGLSVIADAIVPCSLNVQKYAHNKNAMESQATGEPLKHFTRLPLWWVGIVMNVCGELGNLVAYGLAPAAVVAPVGAVGVFFNAVIAVTFLGEPFGYKDAFGLLLTAGGIILVVAAVPDTEMGSNSAVVTSLVINQPRTWAYICALTFTIAVLMKLMPKYGDDWILVSLMLCSLISSVTVVSARSFSSILTLSIQGNWSTEWSTPVPWVSLILIIGTAIGGVKWLNEAMMRFDISLVVPIHYCTFTVCSVVGAAIVYNELVCLTISGTLLFVFGCLSSFAGIFIINRQSKRTKEDATTISSIDGDDPNRNYTTEDDNGLEIMVVETTPMSPSHIHTHKELTTPERRQMRGRGTTV